LNPGGRIVLGFSGSGDERLFYAEIERAGLRVVDTAEDTRWGYNCKYHTLAER
jgi:hypothetical protein